MRNLSALRWLNLLYMVATCAAIWMFFYYGLAHGEDYWTTCQGAYEFCSRRPYHRDCSIWTQHGQPLSVNSFHYKKVREALPEACKEVPWHASCGGIFEQVQDHVTCPIPPEYGAHGDSK